MLSGPSYIPSTVKKAIILCHGYGASGEDMMGIVPYLAQQLPDTAFFAPNAPHELGYGGYEWFSLNDFTSLEMVSLAYLDKLVGRCQKPAEQLREYIAHIQAEYSLTDEDIIIAGFSQGGLMAVYTALTNPYPYAGAVGFSAVPIVFAGSLHALSIKRHIPILLTHGSADETIPVQAVDLSVSELKKAGQDPKTFISQGLPHAIDEACLDHMSRFAQDVFPNI